MPKDVASMKPKKHGFLRKFKAVFKPENDKEIAPQPINAQEGTARIQAPVTDSDIAVDLWSRAYETLRNGEKEDKELVISYEMILTRLAWKASDGKSCV
jgi:hypothetical protein